MPAPRTVVIAGTSRGLGLVLAQHFLVQGWRVAGCSRGTSPIRHDLYEHAEIDLTREQDVVSWIKGLSGFMPEISALIYCAAVSQMNGIITLPGEQLRQITGVNFFGAHFVCREVTKKMIHTGYGRVVTISSVAVKHPFGGDAAYAASKAALETYTMTLAREAGGAGVTANVLALPLIEGGLSSGLKERQIKKIQRLQTVRRLCGHADVIHALEFLVSEGAGMITGQTLTLGGS